MAKVTFIGAGSTVFAKTLMGDLLSFPELDGLELSLMDIDPERLAVTETVARRLAETMGRHLTVTATTDRRRALDGAGYVISMIQVGGYRPATVIDFEIPKKYGLRQTIGDTLGIGGIMRALRTIPVLVDIARDIEELCPQALFINYANPMAMNQWALSRAVPAVRTVGLCHSVQGTARQLAHDLGIPYEELTYLCAGINHMAFYLRLEHNGEDVYPRLRRLVDEGRVPEWNRVRYDMMMRLGYFVTESSEHFSEYVPYFIRRDRPDLIERYRIPLDEYPRRCEEQIAGWQELRRSLEHGTLPAVYLSGEYAPLIIHSMETGTPRTVYANVPNRGLIPNLPDDCVVEVPCLVDRTGVQPTRVGALPVHLAALIQTNVNVQAVAVEAALTGKRDHVVHAAMLDPHTAAELTLDEITAMVDELLDAHRDWLPQFRQPGGR
ncbi:alpha-glucosidase/alpha-galactosidase [Carboxydochorda subterranea]|uniref:Alpha-glucosidase/alpha-galactosidase n=1 Tax=Carboxydichorda subterranea TaxID=3109565 RepID=A0ABZ1BZ38_9FIRM|nr:alpha-glucosidase/alpha-galactosidase [Limnochorda sp. L945t]WRP17954.1 alpha-glucosidase/alpha-galactosidase [Limnochorda sp. L945t]